MSAGRLAKNPCMPTRRLTLADNTRQKGGTGDKSAQRTRRGGSRNSLKGGSGPEFFEGGGGG